MSDKVTNHSNKIIINKSIDSKGNGIDEFIDNNFDMNYDKFPITLKSKSKFNNDYDMNIILGQREDSNHHLINEGDSNIIDNANWSVGHIDNLFQNSLKSGIYIFIYIRTL